MDIKKPETFAYTRAVACELRNDEGKVFHHLRPNSRVKVLPDPAKVVNGCVYLKVQNPSGKVEGWLPKSVLHSKSAAGGSTNPLVPLSGVKYGEQRPLTPTQYLTNDKLCSTCKKPRGDHKIPQLQITADACQGLYNGLYERFQARKKTIASTVYDVAQMVGVLDVVCRKKGETIVVERYFTHTYSRSKTKGDDGNKLANANLEKTLAEFRGWKGIKTTPVAADWGKGVQLFTTLAGFEVKVDRGLLHCAAPRLLIRAIDDHRGDLAKLDYFLSLAEIYFRPVWADNENEKAKHMGFMSGHPADHCDKCRKLVPSLLCGYWNPFKKKR